MVLPLAFYIPTKIFIGEGVIKEVVKETAGYGARG